MTFEYKYFERSTKESNHFGWEKRYLEKNLCKEITFATFFANKYASMLQVGH